ncbi:CUB and zona pellucida-like domain-containing protein 1, partial [Bombina bombina]|uniref:CUB and zona pellucida-like domain-containing protein 1 n=1 Tax=Bombina bombina TaxID=8345 RepID=UPI00235AB122
CARLLIVLVKCGARFTEPFNPVERNIIHASDCTWHIDRPVNETTRLIFSVLNLNQSSDCSQENITVYNEKSEVLGVLCPDSPRISVFESQGSLSVHIFTDFSPYNERLVYLLYYSFAPGSEPAQCGGNLEAFSGTITSPNYPGRHPDFTFCVWHFDVPKNTKIQLTFTEIFIEMDPLCRFDFIALYDGPSTNSPILDILCGRTTAQVETSSNSLTLMLSTDYINSYFGLSADYIVLPQSNTSSLTCSGDGMTVIINPSFLSFLNYHGKDLTLTNTTCGPVSTNPVVFYVPYVGCGTVKKVMDHTISYTNTISGLLAGERVITGQNNLQIIVTCEFDSNSAVEVMYMIQNDIVQEQKDSSQYDISLDFYQSEDFSSQVVETPYFIELNKKLYLQATLRSPDPQLTVFTETCFASPNSNFEEPTYDLIRHGCSKDDTYHNFPSGSGFARFSISAFRFLHSHPSVYLQCRLVICDTDDSESRCKQGCMNRQRKDLSSHKWKANAVVGPIRLKHETEHSDSLSEKREETSNVPQNNLYLLGIMVLIVNALILTLVVLRYQQKQPVGYRYQQLATE